MKLVIVRGEIVQKMNVGEVRKAEEKDFQILKSHLTNCDDEWTLEYEKKDVKVWTKLPPKEQNTNFKLIKVFQIDLLSND